MKTKALVLKSRLLGSGGTASGVLGGIGSIHNVCHSLCVTVVSILAIFGITTSILPLMFLQTYQMYFWVGALVFTAASFYFYLQQRRRVTRDRNLLFINAGLLIFGLPAEALAKAGLPFPQLSDYMDFFRFIGISLAVVGVFLFFFAKKFKYVQYAASGAVQDSRHLKGGRMDSFQVEGFTAFHLPKLTVSSTLFALIVGGFLVNQYFMYRMGIFGSMSIPGTSVNNSAMQSQSRMKLTLFDVALAKERMDKNNDGICDTCGMSIQQCIDSGQLDCNMGNNKDAIGVLGSQHIHANWKIYINGQPFDWSTFGDLHERLMKGDASVTNTSAFIHMHPANPPEKTGDILHMHATKVPLSLFFRSLGMDLTKDSLTLADGRILKNENGNILKFYLNGHKVDDLDNYVFQDLDKLFISYGLENDVELDQQIKSITDFAKDH